MEVLTTHSVPWEAGSCPASQELLHISLIALVPYHVYKSISRLSKLHCLNTVHALQFCFFKIHFRITQAFQAVSFVNVFRPKPCVFVGSLSSLCAMYHHVCSLLFVYVHVMWMLHIFIVFIEYDRWSVIAEGIDAYTHTHAHTQTHARTRAHTRTRKHRYTHTHRHTLTRARAHAHTHARTHTVTHRRARARAHAHTHTHTHTHRYRLLYVCWCLKEAEFPEYWNLLF